MGIHARETEDGLAIKGGPAKGAEIETYKDHRMAMSFAILGLAGPGNCDSKPRLRGKIVSRFLGKTWGALPVNMVLMGYRGTGKTSVGRLLAAKLAKPFLDSDELIEAYSGKTVQEMVEEGGWGLFRREEKRVVTELSAKDGCVVALGGGAVLDEENIRNLKAKGFFIWLTAGAETILKTPDRRRENA